MSTKPATKDRSVDEEYAILNPQPEVVQIGNTEFVIKPLNDFAYQKTFSALVRASNVFINIAQALNGVEPENYISRLASMGDLLDEAIQALLPDSTAIIASAIRKSDEYVQDNFRLLERIKLLNAIFKAERVSELWGEVKALSSQFKTPKAIEQESN